MKKTFFRQFIAVFIIFSLILPCHCRANSANETENLTVEIVAKEVNGVKVEGKLERRGIPLKQGQIYSPNDLVIEDESGNVLPFAAEALQYYNDGSIKWMLLSFNINLMPYEIKRCFVKNKKNTYSGNIEIEKINNEYVLKNNYVSVNIGYTGINGIKYKGTELLSDGGINLYAKIDDFEYRLKTESIQILKQNDLYAKVKMSGKLNDSVNGEVIVTLSDSSKTVDIEYRITSIATVTVSSLGMYVFNAFENSTETIDDSDYLYAKGLGFVSTDNSKYRGSVVKSENTGFVGCGSDLLIAPMIHNGSFTWYDGVSHTNHMYITVDKTAEALAKTLTNPNEIIIAPEQFVAAGIIESTVVPPTARKMISSMHYASEKLDGRFEAGSIPYDIDVDSSNVGTFNTRNGEMEFYLGYGYMATGDSLLYNMIIESAESWADVEIYKGAISEIYGANRYRTADSYGAERFFTSHPYYGDLSGLYMAYILSGNEYLIDVFKIGVEHIYDNMHRYPSVGVNYPRRWTWSGEKVTKESVAESRNMIQARGLYYAYQLFGDEKYKEAAFDILKWGEKNQTDEGYWYQAYYDNGGGYTQGKQTQPAIKNYIYLYGLRGILELSEFEKENKSLNKVINKCADFLCSENEKFGPGLWHPFGDAKIYEVNEDNTRGKSPMTDIMAVDVLYCAYRNSGEQRYFKNLLSLLNQFMCAQTSGGAAAHKIGAEGYILGISQTVGQNMTLFRHCANISKLIADNAETVKEAGYENLLIAFSEESRDYAKDYSCLNYSSPEITLNIYQNNTAAALFGMNITGSKSGDFKKDICVKIEDRGLWQGMKNILNSPHSVTLTAKTNQFDAFTAIKRPIYLKNTVNGIEADIIEYSKDKIVLRLYGNGIAEFEIADGEFKIGKNRAYSISQTGANGSTDIVITEGKEFSPDSNGVLSLNVALGSGYSVQESLSQRWLIDKGYSKDNIISVNDYKNIFEKITGCKSSLKDTDNIKFRDAVNDALKVLSKDKANILNNYGIIGRSMVIVPPKTNREQVEFARDILELNYEGEALCSDLELPDTFIFGTSVEWESSNSDILNEAGLLNRNNIGDDLNVTLTATVTKGEDTAKKVFNIPLEAKEAIEWKTAVAFSECAYPIVEQNSDFELKFKIIPSADKTNALVGITDKASNPGAMSQLPVIARLNPEGYIDAYNLNKYMADSQFEYSKGKEYNFRMSVCPADGTYDVFVSEAGGEEVQIADNYLFRASAQTPEVFNTVYIPAALVDDCFTMSDVSLALFNKRKVKKITDDVFSAQTGIFMGRYIVNDVVLPGVDDSDKISYVAEKDNILYENNKINIKNRLIETMLYQVKDNEGSVNSVGDVAVRSMLTDKACEDDEILTSYQLTKLLKNIDNYYK